MGWGSLTLNQQMRLEAQNLLTLEASPFRAGRKVR
jgi:hypothetical protein